MNTIKLILNIAILLLIGQTSKAQYSFMTRGQVCPFDSAVAMQIDTYRLESRKINLADTIIANLKEQLLVKDKIVTSLQNRIVLRDRMIDLKELQLLDKDKTIELLSKFYIEPKEPTWWESNKDIILFSGGIVVGGSIFYILYNL